MTVDRTNRPLLDPAEHVALARSILSCPASVGLVVDGCPDAVLDDTVGMQDAGGTPTFSCPADSPLAAAGQERRNVLLTLRSGLGEPGSPERDHRLTLAGRLRAHAAEACACCDASRVRVTLEVDLTLLGTETGEASVRVPSDALRSPAHHLNRGYLQRSAEHAGNSHQDELRHAVATATGTPLPDVLGVTLRDLTSTGVHVHWVDVDGGHVARVEFPRAARTPAELGELLRRELHSGLR